MKYLGIPWLVAIRSLKDMQQLLASKAQVKEDFRLSPLSHYQDSAFSQTFSPLSKRDRA